MPEPVPGTKPVLALLMRRLWAAALLLTNCGAHAGVVFTSLHSFGTFANGANPYAGLVQGDDGRFYGTTAFGGTNGGSGTVFRISTNGALTSLYSFSGGNDGGNPYAGLVRGSDRNFYGTTSAGGTNGGSGTVFRISTNGALTSLYSFTGGNDGKAPLGALVQGSDGDFYGTTANGGTHNWGTVFKITTGGLLTTLHAFGTITNGNGDGYPVDGANPQAGLVQGSDGYLYGTTSYGGAVGLGTVFKLSTGGALTSLHSFPTGSGYAGRNPCAGLVQGNDGYFYGTTEFGGTNGAGTVFRINTNGTVTGLYSFTGGYDGANPSAGLVQGADGYLYGTTAAGGATNYSVQAETHGYGTVFKISTDGALTTLYPFTGGGDGAAPSAGLVQGGDGYFYGTTEGGGATNYDNSGTVFKISTTGALSNLYSFTGYDGAQPSAGLVQGADGNFYGTTLKGGTFGDDFADTRGTVFRIGTNGVLTGLFSFGFNAGFDAGAYPSAALAQGTDGNFYGTTFKGGTNNLGTVFRISTNGVLASLYSFTGTNDGGYPQAGLVKGSDGRFYGTTAFGGTNGGSGTVFRISTNGALTSLYSFSGGNDGGNPYAGLVQGNDGYFYGTTEFGGTNGAGTVFRINTNGTVTGLYSFTGGYDGGYPRAGLVQGSDGNFYGTTSGGLPYLPPVFVGYGTVFKITANGVLTTLYSFTGGIDGAYPDAGLVQASDGGFYGTTYSGGLGGYGTVFRLTIVPEPPLNIIAFGANVIMTWPTNYAGFDYSGYTLQSSSKLSSAVWTNVSPNPVVIGGQNVVASPISGTQQFFRLGQ